MGFRPTTSLSTGKMKTATSTPSGKAEVMSPVREAVSPKCSRRAGSTGPVMVQPRRLRKIAA